jgi:glutamine synthetase type III
VPPQACYNQNTNTPYPFIPARALLDLGTATYKLEAALADIEVIEDPAVQAAAARKLRFGLMEKARETCDNLEKLVPAEAWPLATYKELLFLDATNTHGVKLV